HFCPPGCASDVNPGATVRALRAAAARTDVRAKGPVLGPEGGHAPPVRDRAETFRAAAPNWPRTGWD
ncbi:MAG: hypothetical protein ACXVHI_06700, partial [Frankiaceae bacterium]